MRRCRGVVSLADDPKTSAKPVTDGQKRARRRRKRKRNWRRVGFGALVIALVLVAARAALEPVVEWYVNRTIDQHPLYEGEIGDVNIHLWRGAYSIHDIRLNKVTGNVPVPLFAAKQVDLRVQWEAILNGKVVGQIQMVQPELNFVDGESDSDDQTGGGGTGAGGPWLEIVQDLFPFRINSLVINDGSIHFRAFGTDPPVDLYMSKLHATVENLTNIHDDVASLVATIKADALVMDHAKFTCEIKLDPASYRPTFQVAARLVGLDVTKVNDLARAYGQFDFEKGLFDLVVEVESTEGRLEGYVKPMFRNLAVLSFKRDVAEDNILEVFWEALVGVTTEVLENQPRNQFATRIPLSGDMSSPNFDILTVIGNVLRNAFIRAYLPRLEGEVEGIDGLRFGPGELTDPISVGEDS